MIHIGDKRDLASIADDWCSDLRIFLTEEYEHSSRPWTQYNGIRRYFTTRYKKYRFMLWHECKSLKLSKDEMRDTWAVVAEWREQFDACVKADEHGIEALVVKQDNWAETVSRKALKLVFVQMFEEYTKKYAYRYFERLNIRTCPYCNRNYTFTLKKKDSTTDFATRPELDHFHDKSTYPLLALSFFNLVPSCHECNHGKLGKSVGVNPYFKGFMSKFVICDNSQTKKILNANEIRTLKDTSNFNIVFNNPSPEEKENIKNLGLGALYNEHKDYVMDIIDKTVTYDHCLEEGIVDNFQGVFHNPQEIHNLIFGQYFSDENYEKRPLAKLTSDILEQLNIKEI